MRRSRLLQLVFTTCLWLLLLAPVVLAADDHGEGIYGETDDKVVTNAGFLVIAFFPLFVLLMSLLQWRLDKRKDARKKAAKRRAASSEWAGGW